MSAERTVPGQDPTHVTHVRVSGNVRVHPPTSPTAYPIIVGPRQSNWSAGAVDFAAVTAAETREELLRLAGEQVALNLLEFDIEGMAAPRPTQPADLDLEHLVELPEAYEVVYVEPATLSEFGVAIYRAMREEGLTETELARRMGVSHTLANRISDPLYYGHSSNTLRKVAAALGREIVVRLDRPVQADGSVRD